MRPSARSAIWFTFGITCGLAWGPSILVPIIASSLMFALGFSCGRLAANQKQLPPEPDNGLPSLFDADYYSGNGFNRRD